MSMSSVINNYNNLYYEETYYEEAAERKEAVMEIVRQYRCQPENSYE